MSLLNEEREAGAHFNLRREIAWQLFLFELFVAISLSVAFFFLVKPCYLSGESMNHYIFTSGSENFYRLDSPIMGTHWNGRLGGLLLSAALVDLSTKGSANVVQLAERFQFQ